jgi:hypothetical protein
VRLIRICYLRVITGGQCISAAKWGAASVVVLPDSSSGTIHAGVTDVVGWPPGLQALVFGRAMSSGPTQLSVVIPGWRRLG